MLRDPVLTDYKTMGNPLKDITLKPWKQATVILNVVTEEMRKIANFLPDLWIWNDLAIHSAVAISEEEMRLRNNLRKILFVLEASSEDKLSENEAFAHKRAPILKNVSLMPRSVDRIKDLRNLESCLATERR
jgi:hypothetical protein